MDFAGRVESLHCNYIEQPCGAKVIDAGIHATGGLEAGCRLAELSTGCMSETSVHFINLDGGLWPGVEIQTDQPYFGAFISQSGNRSLYLDEPLTIASGPACLLADRENFKTQYDIVDDSDCAVMVMEVGVIPDDSVCRIMAERCGVEPSRLGIVAAPTNSLAGAIQIAGRSVEVAMRKFFYLGFDIRKFTSGLGRCPVAVPKKEDTNAVGRVNDCVVYGSQVWLAGYGLGSDAFQTILPKIPSSSHPFYGRPFSEILEEAGQFFEMDVSYISPAEMHLLDLESGQSGHAGKVNEARLIASARAG